MEQWFIMSFLSVVGAQSYSCFMFPGYHYCIYMEATFRPLAPMAKSYSLLLTLGVSYRET